jgi:hypothetical protein
MSKRSNGNADYYKTARRERPGQNPGQDIEPELLEGKLSRGKVYHGKGGRSEKTETVARTEDQEKAAKGGTQLSQKSGKKSSAQKQAAARHDFGTPPAASPVPGAFGKGGRTAQRGKRRPSGDNIDKANRP